MGVSLTRLGARITHSLKEEDGDAWEGLTGTIPPSATTWPNLHTLAIEDQDLHGDLPRNLSTFYIPTLNTLDFKNNPRMCGAPPFGGGARFNEFAGTEIGQKPWDEELQQCVEPPPPPTVDVPTAPPASAPEPEVTVAAGTPLEPPVPAPQPYDGLDENNDGVSPEPTVVSNGPDFDASAEPTVPSESRAPAEPPSTQQDTSLANPPVPVADPEQAEIFMGEEEAPLPSPVFPHELCDLRPDPQLTAPEFSRHAEFRVILTFAGVDEAAVYCSEGVCQLTARNATLLEQTLEPLDATSYVATFIADGDGEVQIELSPRPAVLDHCSEESLNFQSLYSTIVVDTTPPGLTYRMKTAPTAASSHCALTLVFSELVQQFASSSLQIQNAVLIGFSGRSSLSVPWRSASLGNGTHFDVTLVGEHGKTLSLALSFASYSDLAGNYGRRDFELVVPVPAAAAPVPAETGTAVVLGAMAATAVTTAVSSGSSAGGGGNFVRAVGHTQFLAMCSSLAVPNLPTSFLALSDGYKWALLSSQENATQSVDTTANGDARGRRLMSDGSDSVAASSGLRSGTSQANASVKTRTTSSANPQAFWDKLWTSFGVYALCSAMHYLLVQLIRLFKPLLKLPFILTFPKPQVTVAVMLIPPLIYVGSMVASASTGGGIAALCTFLPLPCAVYLLYVTLRPSCGCHPPLRRHRISTWDETKLEAIEEGTGSASSASTSITEPPTDVAISATGLSTGMTFGKASLSALGRAPTLVLEDDVDTARHSHRLPKAALATLSHAPTLVLEDEDDATSLSSSDDGGEIEREELDPAAQIPVRRRATRWQRKSVVDAFGPGPVAEGTENSKPLSKRRSSEVHSSSAKPFSRPVSQAPLLGRPGRDGAHNPDGLLAQYGPLFDDVIGSDDSKAPKYATLPCLLSVLLYFLCRVLSALIFGVYSSDILSHVQIRLLLAMHSLYLVYLACVRPYSNRCLMITELICHFCEWGILVTALILSEREASFHIASSLLLTLAYIDIGTLTLYECVRIGKYIRQASRR